MLNVNVHEQGRDQKFISGNFFPISFCFLSFSRLFFTFRLSFSLREVVLKSS